MCRQESWTKLRFCNCSGHLNFKGNNSHCRRMKEQTRCSTIDIAGRIEVLHARYFEHAFAPHWHDEFAIGLIDAGVEQFEYAGAVHHATPGEVILLNAGQVHTGQGLDERGFGFRCSMSPRAPSGRSLHHSVTAVPVAEVWRDCGQQSMASHRSRVADTVSSAD